MQTLHIRCHSEALFLIHVYNGVVTPLSSKQLTFMFLLRTYITVPCTVAPPATVYQLLLMQLINLLIFIETHI
jgi:hypothetical protein